MTAPHIEVHDELHIGYPGKPVRPLTGAQWVVWDLLSNCRPEFIRALHGWLKHAGAEPLIFAASPVEMQVLALLKKKLDTDAGIKEGP